MSYHELTEKIWSHDDAYSFKRTLDSIIREYLEHAAEKIECSIEDYRKALGLSTESLSAAGTQGANPVSEKWCEHWELKDGYWSIVPGSRMDGNIDNINFCSKCGSEKPRTKEDNLKKLFDLLDKGKELCGEEVVEKAKRFLKESLTPRTPTEQEELAKVLLDLAEGSNSFGYDRKQDMLQLASRALTWFHEREKRK